MEKIIYSGIALALFFLFQCDFKKEDKDNEKRLEKLLSKNKADLKKMTPEDLTVYKATEAMDNSKGLNLKADTGKEKKVEEKKESYRSESILKVLVNLDSEPKVLAVKLEVPRDYHKLPEVPTVKPLVVKKKLE